MDYRPWKSQLTDSLQSARLENKFTDLTIVTKDESIQAHKLVLSVSSPYFDGLLRTNFSESQSNILKLDNVRGEMMNAVLDFIYTGRVMVKEENVAEILDLAEYFQIPDLKRLCSKFIKDRMDSFYSLEILELGRLHNCQELAEAALEYSIWNCSEVIEDPSFLTLQLSTVATLFKERVLFITSEDELLEALMRWVTHNKEQGSNSCSYLLSLLNPDQINHSLMAVLHSDFMQEYPAIWEGFIQRRETSPRYRLEKELIVAFGGESNGQVLSNTECLASWISKWRCSLPYVNKQKNDFDRSEGEQVIPAMHRSRKHCAIAVQDNIVYLIGGQSGQEILLTCEKYDVLTNRWELFHNLPMPMHGCQAVFTQESLWVAGGNSYYESGRCNVLVMFDNTSRKWCFKSSMLEDRVHFGLATLHGCIYAIGGLGISSQRGPLALASCERYDVERDAWIEIASLGRGRAYHGVVVANDQIYAIGGYDGMRWLNSVERYDPFSDRWVSVSSMLESRSSFGVTVSKGRIYCIGGFGGKSVLNSVESYNPQTNMWQCEEATRLRRYGLASATLKIPSSVVPSARNCLPSSSQSHHHDG